jgi:hypothetical protein
MTAAVRRASIEETTMAITLATLLLVTAWLQARFHHAPRVAYDAWHRRATDRGLVVEWLSMREAVARSLTGRVKGAFDNERSRGWLD